MKDRKLREEVQELKKEIEKLTDQLKVSVPLTRDGEVLYEEQDYPLYGQTKYRFVTENEKQKCIRYGHSIYHDLATIEIPLVEILPQIVDFLQITKEEKIVKTIETGGNTVIKGCATAKRTKEK